MRVDFKSKKAVNKDKLAKFNGILLDALYELYGLRVKNIVEYLTLEDEDGNVVALTYNHEQIKVICQEKTKKGKGYTEQSMLHNFNRFFSWANTACT